MTLEGERISWARRNAACTARTNAWRVFRREGHDFAIDLDSLFGDRGGDGL